MKKFFSSFPAIHLLPVIHARQRKWMIMLFLWVLGLFLYLTNNDYPPAIVFDETYLIPNAQSYLNGVFFQDSHPPLGRLFIALGQFIRHPQGPSDEFVNVSKIEQDWPRDVDISGYRLFPALFGTINPLIAFGIVLILTRNEWVALFSGLALLLDNALITQSRYALTDSILIAFCLGAILCFVWLQSRQSPPGHRDRIIWLLFGLFAGAAFMVKFTGLFVLVVVPFYLYKLWQAGKMGRSFEFLILAGLAFLVVFVSVWEIHFSLLRTPPRSFSQPITEEHVKIIEGISHPNPLQKTWIEVTDAYQYMLAYHRNVPVLDLSKPDEIGSPWYFWPFGGRAIAYRWESGSGQLKIIYLIGNPVTWLISLLGVIGASATVIADLLFKFLNPAQRQRLYPFVCLYWIYMISVMLISRVMYLYHYLPPLVLGIILFGILFVDVLSIPQKVKPRILFVSIICIALAFYLYSPFTYYTEISSEHFHQLDVWPAWDLQCPNC
jgi:dolichyl-phosphate-mannose--protein O-mannosyl transferase